MYLSIVSYLRNIVGDVEPEGDVVKKFRPEPSIKPKRRQPAFQNVSDRDDYHQQYMKQYRDEEGKDYQRVPDKVKQLRKKNRDRLKEKFEVQAEVKPSFFKGTKYRDPTDDELIEIHQSNPTVEDLRQGLGYAIIGRGIERQKEKNMILDALKRLIKLDPKNPVYLKVLKEEESEVLKEYK